MARIFNFVSFIIFCLYFFSILSMLLILSLLLCIPSIKSWIYNILISADQFGNTILMGDADETISSRLGRAYLSLKPKWYALCAYHVVDWVAEIFFKDYNHCIAAIEFETRPSRELWNWEKE